MKVVTSISSRDGGKDATLDEMNKETWLLTGYNSRGKGFPARTVTGRLRAISKVMSLLCLDKMNDERTRQFVEGFPVKTADGTTNTAGGHISWEIRGDGSGGGYIMLTRVLVSGDPGW